MGIEWHLGCLSCKREIWLGSRKPHKWNGFQMNDEDVLRFLSLHASETGHDCDLVLNMDVYDKFWEGEAGWTEDSLSRSFWHSYSPEGLVCASCQKHLGKDATECEANDHLRKNKYLWLCDTACWQQYIRQYEAERVDREWKNAIYDSSFDDATVPSNSTLEVGCICCKVYCTVDYADDGAGMIRDLEYLAHFFCEHDHDKGNGMHILQIHWAIEENYMLIPWHSYDNQWTEYLF